MNHHADKLDYSAPPAEPAGSAPEGVVKQVHTCPKCGNIEMRPE